jgi:hypothetical protein
LVVMAVLGYLCWPHLGTPSAAQTAKQANKGADLTTAMLSPRVDTAFNRDPFKGPSVHIVQPRTSMSRDQLKPASRPTVSKTEAGNLLSGLSLNATMIRGRNRSALINGSIYREGEPLKLASATAVPLKIAQVYPDKVLLQCADQTLVLTYGTRDSKPAGASPSMPRPNATEQKATKPKPKTAHS